MLRILFFAGLVFLSACASAPKEEEQDKTKLPLVIKSAYFSDLKGWEQDNHDKALTAFLKSCERILKKNENDAFGPDGIGGTFGDWQPACREAPYVLQGRSRAFFEKYFTPWQATAAGKEEKGLFTGYYEPSLKGSLTKTQTYKHPLYNRPDDLVMVDLGLFREELKGQRIAGRVNGAHLKPYEDRGKISAGQWPHNDRAFVWVDDPIDSFFLHIQGSGRVDLENGNVMRVGYDGQNGHVYYAIGRELIKRGYMEKADVSLQSIKAWLQENPVEGREVMNLNKSYIFFKELEGEGPLGGEGIALTPERSLAIDRAKIPYGVPMWVNIDAPVKGEPEIKRLVIAQDTGGAINGAVRGDMFWGAGERAAYLAGHMKAQGRYWLLLPRKLQMANAD